ncbi:MAG: sugar ABC transporter substrate-binding protein [Peptoniphilaceae bacterium]|nr:sugar ABC transporter substrate-binding protein [Peptoniphilaceae bacterium]MDY6018331.1 sugar ABC transporter substrate-binding protein [Anaerococcus sp.]
MKKKYKGLLAATMALALVLTACGSKKDKGSKEGSQGQTAGADDSVKGKISVQVEDAWKDYYKAAADRVKKKYPNAEIEFINTSSFDHLDVLDQTDATNKDVADLFAMPADRLAGLNSKQVLASIDSQKLAEEIGGFKDFDKGIGGNFMVDGDYLAFPYNIETLVTFVNKKNAEDAGIDPSKPIELNDVKTAEEVLLPFFDAWYGVAVTNSSGIELLGKDKDKKLFSDLTKDYKDLEPEKQKTIKAIYDYWKKHNEKGTPLFDAEAGWAYVDDSFTTGNGGIFRLAGAWDTATATKQAGEGNLEIYPIDHITVAGKPLVHWKGGWGLAINARLEGKDNEMAIAEQMIKEIVNPKYAIDLFKATGKILENVDASVYADSDLSDSDKAVIDATIKSYENAPARPLFEEWGSVWDSWKNAVLSWNSVNPKNEEEAYKQLQASFKSMMANFKQQ